MATLTIRRLPEDDHDWLRFAAARRGVSVEQYVRQLVRAERLAASRTFADVLEQMNADLDDEERALLAEPLPIERSMVPERELFPPDDDEEDARAAS